MAQGDAKAKGTTVKDVAVAAGVSAMTVSNVLNGRGRVSEETVARVWEAVRALDYRPSVAARRLRLSKQWTIGMLIVSDDADFLNDPFITAQVTGLTNFLTLNQYSLVLRGVRHGKLVSSQVFHGIEADGIVAILSGDKQQRAHIMAQLAGIRLPTVLLQEQKVAKEEDWIVLRQDDVDGGRQVARHLLDCGARELWMVLPSVEWPAFEARAQGIRTELKSVRGPDLRIVRSSTESMTDVMQAVGEALADGTPDAIIGGNDQMAIASMKACKARSLEIPRDIQVVGFNGFEFSRYADPELTTVNSPARALGARAGEALLKRLADGAFEEREIVLPVTLVPAGTTSHSSR